MFYCKATPIKPLRGEAADAEGITHQRCRQIYFRTTGHGVRVFKDEEREKLVVKLSKASTHAEVKLIAEECGLRIATARQWILDSGGTLPQKTRVLGSEAWVEHYIKPKTRTEGECLVWKASTFVSNPRYPNHIRPRPTSSRHPLTGDYGQHRPSRVLYEIKHGLLPKSTFLVNTCGNSLCVNPDHWVPSARSQVVKTYLPLYNAVKSAVLAMNGTPFHTSELTSKLECRGWDIRRPLQRLVEEGLVEKANSYKYRRVL
jgi:hypothetical protein